MKRLEEASRATANKGRILDKFWRSEERHLKTAALLLKGGRIYRGQALEVDLENLNLKSCKVRTLLKIYLKAKVDMEEWYESSFSEHTKPGARIDPKSREEESSLSASP